MDKLKKTARILDKVLKVIFWILVVAVGIVVIGAGVMGIRCAMGYEMDLYSAEISIANIDFKLKQSLLMSQQDAIFFYGAIVAFAVIAAAVIGSIIHILRKIFKPMKEGAPFVGTVSTDIRKLGHVYMVGSIVLQWMENLILYSNEGLIKQMVAESVASINITYEVIDSSMFLVGILLFMLSYIFRYGEELQQQADETL